MTTPLFSIIIPTYNRPDALQELLDNLLLQEYSNYEIIIVDDSIYPSGIKEIIEFNSKLRYFHRGKKLGVSSARNYGASKANGTYFAFIDDDDRVSKKWLSDFAELIKTNNYPDVLNCAMQRSGERFRRNPIVYPSKTLWALVIPGSFILSKRIFDAVSGYDERINFGENTELFFRIRATKPTISHTDSVNFFYNQSESGLSQNLENKVMAGKIYLEKHKALFESNKRLKLIYLSVIGTSLLRLNRFKEARTYLIETYRLKPNSLKAFLRLLISYLPFISRKVYSK